MRNRSQLLSSLEFLVRAIYFFEESSAKPHQVEALEQLTIFVDKVFIPTWRNQLVDLDSPDEDNVEVDIEPVEIDAADVNWNNFSDRISEYFTVGEATNFSKERIPTDPQIPANIVQLAAELDKIRKEWGSPIRVTSWYRPPAVNKRVGGAKNSQHLYGLAADIYPENGKRAEFEEWLDKRWPNALGYGQRSGRGFTHVDLRPGRIRWNY